MLQETVRLDQITVREDFNPRWDIDIDDHLVKSVQQHGVLQPVLVERNGDGYKLIAGERRYMASMMANDVDTIPVVIREIAESEGEGEARVLALIENMKRADLTIVEEAQAAAKLRSEGYTTRRQIATALSVPESRVKTYEQISSLPEDAIQALHKGDVTHSVIPTLATIAAASQELCSYILAEAREHAFPASRFEGEWSRLIDNSPAEAVNEETNEYERKWKPLRFYVAGQYIHPDQLPDLPKEAYDQLVTADDLSPYGAQLETNQADLDAAVAYGCVVHHDTPDDDYMTRDADVITDIEWLTDRIATTVIPRILKKARKDQKTLADERENAPQKEPTANESIESEAARTGRDETEIREERKDEREKEYEERLAAHGFNQALGKQLLERCDELPLSKPVAEMLVALVLRDDAAKLALRGLKYVHPGWLEEHTLKNGKTKLEFTEGNDEARKRVSEFVHQAPTPEQAISRVVQLVAAAEYADHTVVARSRRGGAQLRPAQDAIDGCQAALDAGLKTATQKLTPKLREEALKRREERKKTGAWND